MSLDFDRVYSAYAPLVYRIGVLYFQDGTAAEDLVQDVFVKLFTRGQDFESDGHLKGWLVTVARNHCKNIKAKNARSVPLTEDLPYCDKHDSVLTEVFKLTPKDRLVVFLFYYEGYSSKEIAKMTTSTDMAVRARLKRARETLKTLLTEDENV